MYYYAGKPTGSWYELDGRPKRGWTCGHKHHTIEAASKCADKQEAPGFREWGVFRGKDDCPCHLGEDN